MAEAIGFIGVGVMGEPMCANIRAKSGRPVMAFDLSAEPLERLKAKGVVIAASVDEIAANCADILLSLPGGRQVEDLCLGDEGLVAKLREGQCLVDASTAPVALARRLEALCAERGVLFADAPVARTRQAAIDGTLAIMVGASDAVFDRVKPILDCCGEEIVHCGAAGAGQAVKILNNMVLFQTVVALSEARRIAEGNGIDPQVVFETLQKGSADSFALRNHGMKAILPGVFPEKAFPVTYAQKDLSYALEMAADAGIEPLGANAARAMLERAEKAGFGGNYFPALVETVGK
ncbi:NAD(P)-dependent oxidoreductase [Minwuia thermotolerans]|uniref:2-hydroxy-3-oxopropionate reductase n=1 Tax=Minwuia thermotolerans TaxID=2056226 RepID=A0A2M9FWV3_9PROT|nr:NAD(P)-dependent oxidoreductase [Minwuia thermotolerans]PJK27919.1 2-hydroxy-3-oxopropionate reductase [Minwuia thermotolerans]